MPKYFSFKNLRYTQRSQEGRVREIKAEAGNNNSYIHQYYKGVLMTINLVLSVFVFPYLVVALWSSWLAVWWTPWVLSG